jgi:hypothetical protein
VVPSFKLGPRPHPATSTFALYRNILTHFDEKRDLRTGKTRRGPSCWTRLNKSMSERERGMSVYLLLYSRYILTRTICTLGGLEYDSPEAEPSEDASSAIGPVFDSTFPSTLDLPATTGASTGVRRLDESMSTLDSAVIGPVLETPESLTPMLTEGTPNVNGSRVATKLREVVTADDEIVAEGGEEDESEDGDDEEEEYDDNEDDDDEEEEEEEEEEDDESDEDEEPVLKYSKIEHAAADILEKDPASAIAVGATYFVSSFQETSVGHGH